MRDQEQVLRARNAAAKEDHAPHHFTDHHTVQPRVRVHPKSRAAYVDCLACRRSLIALPGKPGVIGTALTAQCGR